MGDQKGGLNACKAMRSSGRLACCGGGGLASLHAHKTRRVGNTCAHCQDARRTQSAQGAGANLLRVHPETLPQPRVHHTPTPDRPAVLQKCPWVSQSQTSCRRGLPSSAEQRRQSPKRQSASEHIAKRWTWCQVAKVPLPAPAPPIGRRREDSTGCWRSTLAKHPPRQQCGRAPHLERDMLG
jgi:hypothetical protein